MRRPTSAPLPEVLEGENRSDQDPEPDQGDLRTGSSVAAGRCVGRVGAHGIPGRPGVVTTLAGDVGAGVHGPSPPSADPWPSPSAASAPRTGSQPQSA